MSEKVFNLILYFTDFKDEEIASKALLSVGKLVINIILFISILHRGQIPQDSQSREELLLPGTWVAVLPMF